jgi:hypothetical protein
MSFQPSSSAIQIFLKELDQSIALQSNATGKTKHHVEEPSSGIPAEQVAYDYLLEHGNTIDWSQYTPDVVEQGASGRYGRVRLGIGALTGIELVLVRVPPHSQGAIHRHSHCGWAVVLVLEGIEENTLYKEVNNNVKEIGKRTYGAGEILALSEDMLHEISSAHGSLSLHVYSEAQNESCGAEAR